MGELAAAGVAAAADGVAAAAAGDAAAADVAVAEGNAAGLAAGIDAARLWNVLERRAGQGQG